MAALSIRRWALVAAGAAAAVLVFAMAWTTHLRSACTELDTPYLPICPEGAPSVQALRERIARNPGDADAWTRLLAAETDAGGLKVLPGATLTAPYNLGVARWRAMQDLKEGRLAEGVELLVQILRNRTSAEAAGILAQIAAVPEGMALLRPHMAQGDVWVGSVIGGASALKMPPGSVLPLVAEALARGALPDDARRGYMRTLKAGGYWLDAYGLWLAQHKDPVPLLYNGGFDQAFEPDGFDWEYTPVARSRTGVVIDQEAVARRGLVLDLDFTGRAFTSPIVRQYVFAGPGPYRLTGEYMASKLRSEGGLAWTVQCTGGSKAVVGRSAQLVDTGGLWKPLEVAFTVPRDCGVVASVQLEPAAQFEAATGIKGHVAFDGFSLARAAVLP